MTTKLPATIENLPVIKSGDNLNALVHRVFTPDKFNVLVPKAMNISPVVKVAIQAVELDNNSDLKKNKDFWGFYDSDEAIFKARAIRKLSAAANVKFDYQKTGIIKEEYDKAGRPTRIRTKAQCFALDSLGNMRIGTGEYEYNYSNDLNDPRFKKYDRQRKCKTNEIDYDQINRRRQIADRLAITGAKKIAFFECIGIDSSISKSDIGKPFIVPCVVDDIDYNDPGVKRLIAERALGATQDTYGKNSVDADYEIVKEGKVDTSTGEVKTNTQEDDSPQPGPTKESASEPPPEMPEDPTPDKRQLFESDWKGASGAERAQKISELAKKVNYDITKNRNGTTVAPPEEWNDKTQMNWLLYLAEKAGVIPAKQK